jgi:hypothetical protein
MSFLDNKTFNMKKLLLMAAIAFSIASCNYSESETPFVTKRVLILENNTVTFIHVPRGLDSVYRNEDTVWINLEKHRIDDLDSLTMMGVIKP